MKRRPVGSIGTAAVGGRARRSNGNSRCCTWGGLRKIAGNLESFSALKMLQGYIGFDIPCHTQEVQQENNRSGASPLAIFLERL